MDNILMRMHHWTNGQPYFDTLTGISLDKSTTYILQGRFKFDREVYNYPHNVFVCVDAEQSKEVSRKTEFRSKASIEAEAESSEAFQEILRFGHPVEPGPVYRVKTIRYNHKSLGVSLSDG